MLAYDGIRVLEKKVASTTYLHPSSEIAFIEELTLLEKRNLLICEKRLERID